jgi:hypothetical protein
MKIDRFKTADGTYFEGMECELMATHHSRDGSAFGIIITSPQGEEVNLVFRDKLIDVMPSVFESIAIESRQRRGIEGLPDRFD